LVSSFHSSFDVGFLIVRQDGWARMYAYET
jgi:hypothetical protein